MIPFLEYVPDNKTEFEQAVIQLASELRINPEWLMFVMYFETSKTFRPDKINPVSGATGLIQFMPSTACTMGTTTLALKKMTNVEQLKYV
jgi:soluble lytic murein transglycosylase-like protein